MPFSTTSGCWCSAAFCSLASAAAWRAVFCGVFAFDFAAGALAFDLGGVLLLGGALFVAAAGFFAAAFFG